MTESGETRTGSSPARPRDRRADILALAAVLALIPIAFFEVSFLGRTMSTSAGLRGLNGQQVPTGYPVRPAVDHFRLDPGASAWASEPWARVTGRSVQSGRPPLWNPHQGAGAPHAANLQSAALDPSMLPVTTGPTPLRWDLTLLAMMMLGAAGMFVACRGFGLGHAAAIAGTAAFSLSGYFMLYSNNMVFRPYVMLPWLVFLIERTVRGRNVLAVVALAIVIAEEIYIGFAPATFFVLASTGAFGLWRLATVHRVARDRWRAMGRLVAGGAAGLAIASPLLLLAAEYVPLAHTRHVAGSPLGLASLRPESALSWIVPLFTGLPRRALVDGGQTWVRGWVGAGAAFLALAALAVPRARRVAPAGFFMLLGALLLAKIYGAPVVSWLGKIPPTDRVEWPTYASPVAAFALAIACATGVHSFSERTFDRKRLIGIWAAGCVFVALMLALNADAIGRSKSWTARQLGLAVAAGVVVAIAALLSGRRAATWIAAGAVVAELMLLVPRGLYHVRHDPFTEPPWLAAVRNDVRSDPTARTFAFDSIAFPNTAAAVGLHDIRSIDALQPQRYATYIRSFIEPEMAQRFGGTTYGSGARKKELTPATVEGNPMFDLLGVRWVFADAARPPLDTKQYRRRAVAGGVAVYENTAVAPRAFVVGAVDRVEDAVAALDVLARASDRSEDGTLIVSRYDVRARAVVEAPADLASPTAAGTARGSASIITYEPDRITIDVRSDGPAMLVLTDTFYPGWTATVGGREAQIYPANVLFRGVPIPAGRSVVEFRYRPAAFRFGVLIAVLTLVILLAAAVLTRTLRRRGSARDATIEPS